jgi:WD40 repeat protein
LSSSNDSRVILWDVQVGKQILVHNDAHSKANVNQVVWHPVDDNIFASVGADSGLKLWDLKNNKVIASVGAH